MATVFASLLIYFMSPSRVPGKQDMFEHAGTQKLPVLFRFGSVSDGSALCSLNGSLVSPCCCC